MALSDYDKKHLNSRQQQAVLTYTAQYERAIREGNQKAAQMAHEGAEAIRRQAGYSGGATGGAYLNVPVTVSKTIATKSNGKTTYQTVPQKTVIKTERADELDKLNVPSASRQTRVSTAERQGRGGGFTSGRTRTQPTLLTRLGQGIASGLAQSGAQVTGMAGTLMDIQGGTAMTPVYREQVKTLDQQIAVLEKELSDPQLTELERQEANEALQIAREQRNAYARATGANQGTAQKLYETTDEGLRYARNQADKSVRGTSGLERDLLVRVPGMTQAAGASALNLLAPGLGTTTAILGDAGATETQYRRESGADYDAKTAGALGAKVIGSEAANLFGQAVLWDYAEMLRKLYAGKRQSIARAEPARFLPEAGEPQPSQSAYADALSRLEVSNGTDLTKPVSAYDAPPSVIELPETLQPTMPAPEQQTSLADLYKEAYNATKETAKRYPKPKIWGTFPPYDKSFSEANELATRWAHREDIEAGDQRPISYHGKWYLIEKFDSADLKYQIVDTLTERKVAEYQKEYNDYGKSGKGQSLSDSTDSIDTLHQ